MAASDNGPRRVATTVYTVGHSTRPVGILVGMLREHGVEFLADVRSMPRSHRNPQYDSSAIARALSQAGIRYGHMPALGGLRATQPGVTAGTNAAWEEGAFRNYADYALSHAFRRELELLTGVAGAERCAVMCAEADWRRCHRRIIADHLVARGVRVRHLLSPGVAETAVLDARARVAADGLVTYPSGQGELF
jgi:uncharacterized protein (DUF488 family)